ncbi:MAG: alpha/beta hydrolase [Alphaproteobacteria bacterium]|nr:alpha/beta hydrolase [Alphaproteobacteria bacterium]
MSAHKPPVVMIHGAFCGGWVFEGWARRFRDAGYRVFTPDLPYHGALNGALEGAQVSLLDYADDLAALIGRLEDLPVVIGHAMGGLLAQMLAARGKACAAVLLAPAAPWGIWPRRLCEFRQALALLLAGAFWRKRLRPESWLTACGVDRLEPHLRAALCGRLVDESGLALFETLYWPFDRSRASWVEARRVVCPILCLSGEEDRIAPPVTVRRIARRYQGRAQYRVLKRASHWLFLEPGSEKLVAHTLVWLARLQEGRAASLRDGHAP